MAYKAVELSLLYDSSMKERLNQALRLGYHMVAVDVRAGHDSETNFDHLRSEMADLVLQLDTVALKTEGVTYKQWLRITYNIEDKDSVGILKNPKAPFDIVAVATSSSEVLEAISSDGGFQNSVHVLAVDLAKGVPDWLRNEKSLAMVSKSGIPVELWYGGMIADSSIRSEAIAQLRLLFDAYREGQLSIVLSCGSANPMDIRAPKDVANMLNLWDLPEHLACKCTTSNAYAVLLRALGPDALIHSKPMTELVHALGLRVRRSSEADKKRRRTKRRKMASSAAN